MGCCSCTECYGSQFDDKRAKKDLARYRKDGPDPTTRALIDALRRNNLESATLLDVGGGVGAIHHELLDAGVASATQVDASAPYLGAARQEAERRGHADRVEFVHGDFVEAAPTLGAADVVTLDRVICCYGDMEALVAASAYRARKLYGAVYPRERLFLRVGFALVNLFKRVTRDPFRAYLHPVAAIDAALRGQGFEPRSVNRTFVWQVAVYARIG